MLSSSRLRRSSILALVLAVTACGDDDSDAGNGSAGEAGTDSSGGDDGPGDGPGSSEGGSCSASISAHICPAELAAILEGEEGSGVCEEVGGDGDADIPDCSEDMTPTISEEDAESVCEQVCGDCSCGSGTYSSCSFEAIEDEGAHRFRCSFQIGCASGGCEEGW